MNNLIYIKVHKGYIEARTYGEHNERKFYSNGLNHPRTLAGDIVEVEKAFKEAISAQPKKLLGLFAPNILIHLVPEMDGGYTTTELRFFKEAAVGGGAKKVYLMTDKYPPLKDAELYDAFKSL